MEPLHLDRAWSRGRSSVQARRARLRTKAWQVAQCALAAGVAWFLAAEVLGHESPFFAPIAAVLSLGTSYGQRLRRVAEVTIGVAIGVLVGDLLVAWLGTGPLQLALIVALAMTTAILLDGGQLFVTQAAVQSIVVATLLPGAGQAFTRWTDALIGGAVALVAATVVPAAALRRPREQAAVVVHKIGDLLRAAGGVMTDGQAEPALALLADARSTDHLISELQSAANEGLSVVASSPFRVRHKGNVRLVAELVEPMDRALRSTRVLVRRAAVAAYRREPVPSSWALLCADLAAATDLVAQELSENRMAEAARPALLAVAQGTAEVEQGDALIVEVILVQMRSVIVDLLLLTGLDTLEATDLMPPLGR